MNFIEIPKFTKIEKEIKTGVDKWLFVLKNMSKMQKIPTFLNTKIFSKLFNIASVSNLTKEEYMSYERDMKATWDEYATRMTIEHDRKEALEKGREQGLEQGKKQWKEEGKEEKSTEIVKNLLAAKKFSVEEISNFANVPEAFVLKLKKGMK